MQPQALETWHQVVAERNVKALESLLADEVIFYSPVVHTPQVGKALTQQYLIAAFYVFFNESFHYINQTFAENSAVLEFEVTIDEILINGVDMIEWNEQGKVSSFKVMIRPLKAINLIHQKMAAMLERS